jgi:hypothetical protein
MQVNQLLLWGGIAAAGLAVGIVSRMIRRRRQRMPTMLILEAC